MLPENRQALMCYRLSMAKERLDSSKLLLEHASYKDSIGRSYYAMFTAVRAILALDGVDFKKHAGVISYFQRKHFQIQGHRNHLQPSKRSRSDVFFRGYNG